MKLHLPLLLRSALLAVLSSISLSVANDHITIHAGEEYTLEERTYEDLSILIEKDGVLNISRVGTYLTGVSAIDVYGSLDMTQNGAYGYSHLGYIDESGEIASTTINVYDGGIVNNGISIGAIYIPRLKNSLKNTSSSTIINVGKGGTFNNIGDIGGVYGDEYPNYYENDTSDTTININGGTFKMGINSAIGALYQTNNSHDTTNINITNGGVFEMTSCVGDNESAWIGRFVMGYATDDHMAVNICVDGGSFEMGTGTVGYIGHPASSLYMVDSTLQIDITVKNGGRFTMDYDSENYDEKGLPVIAYCVCTHDADVTTAITVEEGGVFELKNGYIGRVKYDQDSTISTTINVEDGTFIMRGGATSDGSGTSAEINVKGKGLFQYEAGTLGSNNGEVHFTLQDEGILNINGKTAAIDITMQGGKLVGAENYNGKLKIDVESGFAGTSVDMGGVNAARITNVKVAQPGVQISGLMAGSELTLSGSDNQLAVGVGNTNLGGSAGQALIVFNGDSGTVSFNSDSDTLTLMLDIRSEVLKAMSEQDIFTICLTNGTINNDWQKTNFTFRGVLYSLDFEVLSIDDGTLVVYGNTDNLFISSRDGKPSDNTLEATPDDVQEKDAVIVDAELTVNTGVEGVTMNHVDSMGEDADLTVKGNNGEDINDEFHNEKGVNTELGGDLSITNEGDGKAHMDKTGEGRFTVGGNLNVDGNLNVKEGGLTLDGEDSHVGGDLNIGDKENDTEGNLEVNGSLTVDGTLDLENGNGSITGDGDIHITEDGSLKMGDGVDLDGPSLTVDGKLDMNGQDTTLGGLGGDGTVTGPGDITIDGEGGDFSGDLTGSGSITVTGEGTDQSFTDAKGPNWDLEVKDGGRLSLTESTFHDVEAKKDGNLEFRAKGTGTKDNGGANVHLTGDLIFRNGSTTTLTFNMNADKLWKEQNALMVSVDGTIYIEREARFVLSALQDKMPAGRGGDLTNVLVMQSRNDIQVGDEFDLTDEVLQER